MVLFHKQMALTAEKVKRMLLTNTVSLDRERIHGLTYHRAMLNPQMDFICRHVDLEVPIHWE